MNRPTPSVEQTLQMLQQGGHRVTGPRRVVVEAAQRQAGPFSADELLQALERSGQSVGRATVFRTLDLLAQCGVLDRLHGPDGCHNYVVTRGANDHHHHLICSGCGAVVEFEECNVDAMLAQLGNRTNFCISGHWLEVFGVCAACRG